MRAMLLPLSNGMRGTAAANRILTSGEAGNAEVWKLEERLAACAGSQGLYNRSSSDCLGDLAALLFARPELDGFCRFGGSWLAGHEDAPQGVLFSYGHNSTG